MAKISVILNCRMDNGKDVKQPGSTVNMDEKEAAKLVEMGMASYPASENKPARASSRSSSPSAMAEGNRSGKEDEGLEAGDDLDPDALDRTGAAGNINGEEN